MFNKIILSQENFSIMMINISSLIFRRKQGHLWMISLIMKINILISGKQKGKHILF